MMFCNECEERARREDVLEGRKKRSSRRRPETVEEKFSKSQGGKSRTYVNLRKARGDDQA